jgi:hypothetical protein
VPGPFTDARTALQADVDQVLPAGWTVTGPVAAPPKLPCAVVRPDPASEVTRVGIRAWDYPCEVLLLTDAKVPADATAQLETVLAALLGAFHDATDVTPASVVTWGEANFLGLTLTLTATACL